jgi:hypothetical protein
MRLVDIDLDRSPEQSGLLDHLHRRLSGCHDLLCKLCVLPCDERVVRELSDDVAH